MDKTSLGDRMKGYENIERRYLPKRMPMIIRIDGKAFHNYTKGFERPFDISFLTCMRQTMLRLCEQIPGAKLGYTQSDEITILVTDDDRLETYPWFNKNVQKIVSISAAMATAFFNQEVARQVAEDMASIGLTYAYESNRLAIFDARCFVLPREEVLNAFEWRQQDAVRNSIQSVGQAYFSHKALDHKNCNDIQDMLFLQKGINWNDYSTDLRRGACAIKVPTRITTPEGEAIERMKWIVDTEVPIFHKLPEYINSLVYHKEA